MSNYGVFEASSTDGHEEEQRQRQATRDLGRAIEAAREGFGDFLGAATDKDDYKDRLALVMNDLMQKVADSGVMPVPGVMRKVKAALRPEFKVAKDLSGLSDEELAKQYSTVDYFSDEKENLANELNSRGLTTTDVTRLLRSRKHSRSRTAAPQTAGWRDEVGQAVDEYLDATSTPRIAPHPEYGEGVWSDEGVKQRVLSLNPNLPVPELVDAIMREMGDFYDSIDRELAFWYFSQVTGRDYDDFYNAWMNLPSGKYFSRRKTALKWKDTDFNSWVKMDGGAWSLEVEEVGGDFWVYFNGGPADGQMEQLSASSMEEAKAEAESIASSKGITASRKQANLKSNVEEFLGWMSGHGYTLPRDAGYPGDNNTFDDELWEYVRTYGGDENAMRQFLIDNWDFYAYGVEASRKRAEKFQPGDKVMKSGYPGTVQNEYMDGMYEVKMERGTVVVPAEELTRVSSRRTASIDELQSYVESKGVATTPVGTGFEFPLPTGADGEIFENRNGDFVVQTLVSGGGGISSLYTKDEVAAVKGWIDASLSGRASRKQAAPRDTIVFDSLSELLYSDSLPEEDRRAVEDAYGAAEKGNWEAAYNAIDFVAGESHGDRIDRFVDTLLDDINALVGDPSRSAAKKDELREGQQVSVNGKNGRIDEIRGDRITVAFPGEGIDFFRADQIRTTLASRKGERKQALELGEWEEDLPGLGYAKATKVPGGGWEVYIWDEAGQNETLTPVNSSEEARRLFYDVIKSYPGSGYDYIDF